MKRYIKLIAVFMVVATFALGSNGCGGCGGGPSDTVNPAVTITSPSNGSTVSGTVTITATASDNVGVAKVEFYIDNNKVGEDTTSPYEYNWNTDNLQYGSQHTIQAKAYDNAGNVGESPIVTVTIGDTQAPLVTITNPQDGSTVSGTVQIQVSVQDRTKKKKAPSGIQKVEFYIDGIKVGEDTSSPYEYRWNTMQVNNGIHTIIARAYDNAGNNSSASIIVNVNNPWQKVFGGSGADSALSIQQTNDGGYIVAGYTDSFSTFSGEYVLKLNANGDLDWQRNYGGESRSEYAYSIKQTSDGGYIVAGYEGRLLFFGTYDVCISKLKDNGDLNWGKAYDEGGDDYAYSIQQTRDGSYIVAGKTESLGNGGEDVYILKLDANGNFVWHRTYGGSNDDCAYSIQQTSDGGYIVAGETESFGNGGKDVFILRFDANENFLWRKTYGGGNNDCAYSVQQTNDGGYIVAGYTVSSIKRYDIYILKLDANGNFVWQKIYGGSNNDYAYSIQQTSDGGYIVAGSTESFGNGGKDVYILKLDANGNFVWHKTYGGSNDDCAYSIQQTSDGGYIVAGETESFGNGGKDVYVLKLDSNGNTGPYPTSLSRKNSTKDKTLLLPPKK